MRKSKHFRKDVIIARAIAAAILLLFFLFLHLLLSVFVKPSVDSSKNSQYQEQNDWKENEFNSGYVAPKDSETETSSEEETATAEPEEVFIRTTAQLRVRSGPGTDYEAIGYLEKDTKVLLIEEAEGWYKISYEGKEAYVSADYAVKIRE